VFLSEVREILSLYLGLWGSCILRIARCLGRTILVRREGGGGTSFVPLFRRMEVEADGNGLLISRTDGHGTFPREASVND
jgi:predicted metal-dependent peptidase